MLRYAWHIGNRHTPCALAADQLVIQRDPVIKAMLLQLGAEVRDICTAFTPEGGAYGHGRTMGHDHGPADAQGAAHSHDHGHDHSNDHGHAHHGHSHD
jgi:urease accessory protein